MVVFRYLKENGSEEIEPFTEEEITNYIIYLLSEQYEDNYIYAVLYKWINSFLNTTVPSDPDPFGYYAERDENIMSQEEGIALYRQALEHLFNN